MNRGASWDTIRSFSHIFTRGDVVNAQTREVSPPKNEPLPGVLGNTGTVAFIFREQGIFSNYFQGTGELLTRLLGSFLGTRGFSNGEQGIKSKKVKGSWEHAPPPLGGAQKSSRATLIPNLFMMSSNDCVKYPVTNISVSSETSINRLK